MKPPEECRGCILFRMYGRGCHNILSDTEKDCPCRSCLIKVVCQVVCCEYSNYMDKRIKNESTM